MEWLISIVSGIVTGIISSIIIFLIVWCIKPKIKISSDICREVINSKTIYKIKIVNLSRIMLNNVKYSLYYQEDNGQGVSTITNIEPQKIALDHIDPYRKEEDYTDYAIRLTFDYNEEKFPLKKNAKLEFVIFAEHSFSNKGKCFKAIYSQSNLKSGTFETGKSTKIIL